MTDDSERCKIHTRKPGARKLLLQCDLPDLMPMQANGSLYIKAAQTLTTIPSVPQPYRQ